MESVDRERVLRLTSELRKAVGFLRELSVLPREEFLADPHKKGSAKYYFVLAVEAAVDLCNHAISRFKLRAPEDYADSFAVLAEAGAFNADFLEKLKAMARFRNRLVHVYFDVSDEKLYEFLRKDLPDFERFLDEFGAFISDKR